MDVHFHAFFHFSLYTFTLSFTAWMDNPASPVLTAKNTEANFCQKAPVCQDCDRHFPGPPNNPQETPFPLPADEGIGPQQGSATPGK